MDNSFFKKNKFLWKSIIILFVIICLILIFYINDLTFSNLANYINANKNSDIENNINDDEETVNTNNSNEDKDESNETNEDVDDEVIPISTTNKIVSVKIDRTKPITNIEKIKTTTSKIRIFFNSKDEESGIKKIVCEYGKDETYKNIGKIENNTCIFDNLDENETYYYRIISTNNSNLNDIKTGIIMTGKTSINFVPESNDQYVLKNNIKVNYEVNNITNYKKYIKSSVDATSDEKLIYICGNDTEPKDCKESNTKDIKTGYWYITSNNPTITFENNGILYALIDDGDGYSSNEKYIIKNVDATKPKITIGKIETTTRSIKIPFTSIDEETGIKEIKCEYGQDKKYGNVGKIENGICFIDNLEENTTYYYKISVKNNIGNSQIYNDEQQTDVSTINFIETQEPLNQEWATTKYVNIDFSPNNVNNYEYYVRLSSAVSLDEAPQYICGNKVDPENCIENTKTNLSSKYWYRVNKDIFVKFKTKNDIEARIYYNNKLLLSEKYNVDKVDSTVPSFNLRDVRKSPTSINYSFSASDSSPYEIIFEYGTTPNEYTNKIKIDNSSSSYLLENLNIKTTYYYKFTVTNASGLSKVKSGEVYTGDYICQRAKTLHIEKCEQSDARYFCSSNSKFKESITYGNLSENGKILALGDALDCDIDGDGLYGECATVDGKTICKERFYYLTKSPANSNYASLIYYSNVDEDTPVNSRDKTTKYGGQKNTDGPTEAILKLPTINQWSNIQLVSTTRTIKSENGKTVKSNFKYTKKVDGVATPLAARLLTYQEITTACDSNIIGNCHFLLENTRFSNNNLVLGYLLENASATYSNYVFSVNGEEKTVYRNYIGSTNYGVRPVIDIDYNYIKN